MSAELKQPGMASAVLSTELNLAFIRLLAPIGPLSAPLTGLYPFRFHTSAAVASGTMNRAQYAVPSWTQRALLYNIYTRTTRQTCKTGNNLCMY